MCEELHVSKEPSNNGQEMQQIHIRLDYTVSDTYCIARVHYHYVLYRGCGRIEAHNDWSMVIPEKAAPVIETTLRTTGSVPADSRQ